LFFQLEQYFSLTTTQPTVFFSRLISPTEHGQRDLGEDDPTSIPQESKVIYVKKVKASYNLKWKE
jgi:hypothetical protein